MQLILDTKGLVLTTFKGAFLIKGAEEDRRISPKRISSIAITNSCMLESKAVLMAVDHEIPILFFDFIGKAKAKLWSPYYQKTAQLLRQQIRFAELPAATNWLIDMYRLKTMEQARVLRWMEGRTPDAKVRLQTTQRQIVAQAHKMEVYRNKAISEFRQHIMGVEGLVNRTYFQTLGKALDVPYSFEGRSRRPAKDIFNAALNYLYGMLYTEVERAIWASGLSPQLALLHTDKVRLPTLAFDLIEPFRPWVDELLIEECVERRILKGFFSSNQHGIFLNKNGKKHLIPLFNDMMSATTHFERKLKIRKTHLTDFAEQLTVAIRLIVASS